MKMFLMLLINNADARGKRVCSVPVKNTKAPVDLNVCDALSEMHQGTNNNPHLN